MSARANAAIEKLLPANRYTVIGRNVVSAGSQKDPKFLWATLWVNRTVDESTRAGRIVVRANGDVELFGSKFANLRKLGSD